MGSDPEVSQPAADSRLHGDPRDQREEIAVKMLVFDFPGVTSQQYDQLCRNLNNGELLTTLADLHRAGYRVVSHVAGPTPDGGWRVVDVWESDEALETFRQRLAPLLENAGIPVVAPQVFPVHNAVTR
jgi:hypothetical protein